MGLMADVQVRTARREDARALAQVHLASWRSTYSGVVSDETLARMEENLALREQRYRDEIARQGEDLWFVAEAAGGRPVGFARGGPARPPHFGLDGELGALYLLQEFQRRGIGRALVFEHARALRALGYRSMLVWVLSANPARGFYEHLGGRRLGTQEAPIGDRRLEETAFGWRDLGELERMLEAAICRKPFY